MSSLMVWVFSISLGILYRFITTLTKYQRISNSELVQNWTSIGLELEVDWTCFEGKAIDKRRKSKRRLQISYSALPSSSRKKVFCVFPVTLSHRLIINALGRDRNFFSCHAPITHVTAT